MQSFELSNVEEYDDPGAGEVLDLGDGFVRVEWPCGTGHEFKCDYLSDVVTAVEQAAAVPDAWVWVRDREARGMYVRVQGDDLLVTYDEPDMQEGSANWPSLKAAIENELAATETKEAVK
jgi:hypothetical protein